VGGSATPRRGLRRAVLLRETLFRGAPRALAFRVVLRTVFREAFRAPVLFRERLALRAPPRELVLRDPARLRPVLLPRGGIRLLPRACGSQSGVMQASTKPRLRSHRSHRASEPDVSNRFERSATGVIMFPMPTPPRGKRKRAPPSSRPPRQRAMKPPPVSTPKPPPRGTPPNPRRPRLVRDVNGGFLGNLFTVFPDLPWPPRPRGRVPTWTLARRLRRF
jgi:hypothetical protein